MLENANLAFTVIFTLEAAMKITGLGWSYFKNNWNCFDFFLVVISLITLAMKSGSNLSIFRIFRVFRVIRLIRSLKGLSSLLTTLVLSLPSIANVTSLLALLIFVYSILGMEFFYHLGADRGTKYINSHTKFTNFGWSVLTLFRCLTGESWNGIMHDTMEGTSGSAWLYWVTFEILGAFMLLNLFVAIVIDHFEESRKLSGPDCPLEADDIESFKVAWSKLDDNADGEIRWEELEELLRILGKNEESSKNRCIMGLGKKDRRIHLLRRLKHLGMIPVRKGMIFFPEVIYYVSKYVLEEHAKQQPRYDKVDLPNSKVRRQAEKEYARSLRHASRTDPDYHTLAEHWAGTIMVRATKRYLNRIHDRRAREAEEARIAAEEESACAELMARAMAKRGSGGVADTVKTENPLDAIGLPPAPRKRKKGPGVEGGDLAPLRGQGLNKLSQG